MLRLLIALVALPALSLAGPAFVHPGLLHGSGDLARMKQAVVAKTEPIHSGFERFRMDPASQANYRMRGPLPSVSRLPNIGQVEYDADANAAYQCALMWAITGERAFAETAIRIVDAWSSTLQSIGGQDAVLMAGLGPFKMINAAEILRHTGAGWTEAGVRQAERHFREVVYPVVRDYAPFANGNWDNAAIKTALAVGVFCDDRGIYEDALRYYIAGTGDGSLRHYIVNDNGQCQESGRDQQHTQLGLGHMGDCCEIAWHQGLNLYGYDDNRLLKGFEYTARYNLGKDVPFQETIDRTGKYRHTAISDQGRGRFRAIHEQIHNAYANRLGIRAPWTGKVVRMIRPEGVGVPTAPLGADHPGFGTLLFAGSPRHSTGVTAPRPPAGLSAEAGEKHVRLRWIESLGATGYTVLRSGEQGTPSAIGRDLRDTTFTDRTVEGGRIYRYTVVASNRAGQSDESFPLAIGAGLPRPWTTTNIGTPSPGATCDGETFTLEAAGNGMAGTADDLLFVSRPLHGDATLVARFVPQTSSQSSQFGLMLRAGLEPDSPQASLLISQDAGKTSGASGWRAHVAARSSAGSAAEIAASSETFAPPVTSFGRLTGAIWLKLARRGNRVEGFVSHNGTLWMPVGATDFPESESPLRIGLAACSRLPRISTAIRFDHVELATP